MARDTTTIPGTPAVTAILARASAGGTFASGVPRYAFGDEIERPQVNGTGAIAAGSYWRAEPVKPGEVFGLALPLIPKVSVSVTRCSTGTKEVTVAAVPPGLVSGATLLGQRVDIVDGLTLTLRGEPGETIGRGEDEGDGRGLPGDQAGQHIREAELTI